jgi:hypothetical protein
MCRWRIWEQSDEKRRIFGCKKERCIGVVGEEYITRSFLIIISSANIFRVIFEALFYDAFSSLTIQCRMVGRQMNGELEGIWKKGFIALRQGNIPEFAWRHRGEIISPGRCD